MVFITGMKVFIIKLVIHSFSLDLTLHFTIRTTSMRFALTKNNSCYLPISAVYSMDPHQIWKMKAIAKSLRSNRREVKASLNTPRSLSINSCTYNKIQLLKNELDRVEMSFLFLPRNHWSQRSSRKTNRLNLINQLLQSSTIVNLAVASKPIDLRNLLSRPIF